MSNEADGSEKCARNGREPGQTGDFLQKVLEPSRTGPSFKRLSVRNFGLGQERV
jgi:hypothetical protein